MANIANSDVGTVLLYREVVGTGKFYKIMPITSVPALGAAGGTIEVTELESKIKQYVDDRPDNPEKDFNYNSNEPNEKVADYISDGLAHEFLIVYQDYMGAKIQGTAANWINELGRGSARESTLHIVPSSTKKVYSSEILKLLNGAVVAPLIAPQEIYEGDVLDIKLTSLPAADEGVVFTATSGTPSTATVTVNGDILTIEGVAAGNTTITVTATKSPLTAGTTTIELTVIEAI